MSTMPACQCCIFHSAVLLHLLLRSNDDAFAAGQVDNSGARVSRTLTCNQEPVLHLVDLGESILCELQVDIYTASGAPAVSTPVLRSLAGKPGAAKKALLELEGQDTSDSPADDFDGECRIPVSDWGEMCCTVLDLPLHGSNAML